MGVNQGDGTVQRVDGKSSKLLATIETGLSSGRGGDIVCGAGYVWISLPGTPVAQIDPRTNALCLHVSGRAYGRRHPLRRRFALGVRAGDLPYRAAEIALTRLGDWKAYVCPELEQAAGCFHPPRRIELGRETPVRRGAGLD